MRTTNDTETKDKRSFPDNLSRIMGETRFLTLLAKCKRRASEQDKLFQIKLKVFACANLM